jgi:ketosteroid isomerase-like protein
MTTAEVVNEYLRRLDQRDADGVGELFAEEIDWYVPGDSELPWTGRRSRRADVPEYLNTLWPQFEPGKSTATLEKILIDGEDAAIFLVFEHTVARTGRTFRTPVAMQLQVKEGQIVTMHLFEDTATVSNAFFD